MRCSWPTQFLCLLVVFTACRSGPPVLAVETWGGMRETLREGNSQARVALTEVSAPGVIGVGALAGLEGEVTIVDGRVLVARASGDVCEVADADAGDQATLLVCASVEQWREYPVGACDSYVELEEQIAQHLERRGYDRRRPTPVRIRGRAPSIDYHVIAGACPIADPDGPAPWRFRGRLDQVELLGIYVEGAAGTLTHHTHHSHLHVVAEGRTGHLDEVVMREAVLLLPN
jgi:hypothetical protein